MEKKPIALCTSFKCVGEHILNYSKAVEKQVNININICPDCGSGLVWMKDKKRRSSYTKKAKGRDYSLNS